MVSNVATSPKIVPTFTYYNKTKLLRMKSILQVSGILEVIA